jgi:polar amino acid transport system substrate-binding protein
MQRPQKHHGFAAVNDVRVAYVLLDWLIPTGPFREMPMTSCPSATRAVLARKSWLTVAVFAATATALMMSALGPARAASLEEIRKRGYMVVATEDDFRPFEFIQEGKPAGFDNEMLELLRKAAPFEVRQEIIPWTGLLAGVTTGKYDLALTAVLITRERKNSLDFTIPIADATHYYIKRKSDTSINEIKDLNAKTVGVQAGSALLQRLPELDAMLGKTGGKLGKVVEYTSYPEAYQDLALGRTDFVVNTVINLQALVNEKPNVFALGQAVSGPSLPAWAVKKDNSELLAFLNGFLAEKRKDGTAAKLQQKWFGKTFDDLPTDVTPTF